MTNLEVIEDDVWSNKSTITVTLDYDNFKLMLVTEKRIILIETGEEQLKRLKQDIDLRLSEKEQNVKEFEAANEKNRIADASVSKEEKQGTKQ